MLCTPFTNCVASQTVSLSSPSQAAIVPDISIGLCVSVGVRYVSSILMKSELRNAASTSPLLQLHVVPVIFLRLVRGVFRFLHREQRFLRRIIHAH